MPLRHSLEKATEPGIEARLALAQLAEREGPDSFVTPRLDCSPVVSDISNEVANLRRVGQEGNRRVTVGMELDLA